MCADIADKGNDRMQEMLDDALASKRDEGPQPCGYCHYCGETVGHRARFCEGIECRDDYFLEQKIKKGRGDE